MFYTIVARKLSFTRLSLAGSHSSRYKMQVIGHRLQVIGYRSQVAGHRSQVTENSMKIS